MPAFHNCSAKVNSSTPLWHTVAFIQFSFFIISRFPVQLHFAPSVRTGSLSFLAHYKRNSRIPDNIHMIRTERKRLLHENSLPSLVYTRQTVASRSAISIFCYSLTIFIPISFLALTSVPCFSSSKWFVRFHNSNCDSGRILIKICNPFVSCLWTDFIWPVRSHNRPLRTVADVKNADMNPDRVFETKPWKKMTDRFHTMF